MGRWSRESRQEREAFWRGHLEKCGQTPAAKYCREHQLKLASFYSWRRKLAFEPNPTPVAGRSPRFLPVRVTQESIGDVELHTPQGYRIVLRGQTEKLLPQLLAMLGDR